MNSLLVVHDQNQDADIDLWRIVVPDNPKIKEQHSMRVAQPLRIVLTQGTQRTIARVPEVVLLERNAGGWCRQFVENCTVCQMEKSDHTLAKGKLQSTQDSRKQME